MKKIITLLALLLLGTLRVCAQTTNVAGSETIAGPRPWIDVVSYGADPTGVADSTAAIQAAHNASVALATGPTPVYFPYGTYLVNSGLTWSPYVPAIALARVIIQTPLASGNFISISDQYGKPTPDPNSAGLTRSKTFTGNFQFQNTNAANTAFLFAIGGATSANFASQLSIDGVGATGFKGGVFLLGYNTFMVHISNFFGNANAGSYFSSLAGATNHGESISVDSSTFSGASAYLISWNTGDATDFHFTNCSFDYLKTINDNSKTAILTSVNMTDSHFEWNETTAPYIYVDNGIIYKITNAKFFTPLTGGFFSPFVGKVHGASALYVSNARYESGGTISLLYDNNSATVTNLLSLDPYVISTSPAPTTYFTASGGASARVVFNGVPANLPAAYDLSAFSVGIGNLYLGGNSAATNIPQFIAVGASTVAGVTDNNYGLAVAGASITEAHDTSGDLGLLGFLSLLGATPTGSGSSLGLGNTTGFGAGSAGTAVTTTTKGGGSGPTTPQTVVKYLEIDLGGTKYWIPLVQ